MTIQRILIVDDQSDVRRVLRAGLETLGLDLRIIDVPSGEEAMLIISHQPIDLLVSDVRLPGISGLELKQRALSQNPNLQLILVTGMIDESIRKQVSESGAAAFFFKPVEMPDFLSTVERCLGLTSPLSHNQVSAQAEDRAPRPDSNLSSRLEKLCRDLNLVAALILDEQGEIRSRAGELPAALDEPGFLPVLSDIFGPLRRAAAVLRVESPGILTYLPAAGHDFFLAPLGPAARLVLVAPSPPQGEQVSKVVGELSRSVPGFLASLEDEHSSVGGSLAESLETPRSVASEIDSVNSGEGPGESHQDEPVADLELLFRQASEDQVQPVDVDAFWDSLTGQGLMEGALGKDALSYEEARRLGLAPDEEDV